MSRIRFDHLVTALADAVVEAEHVIRRHQLSDIRGFFNEKNEPVSIDLKMQRTDPAAKPGDLAELHVPLITLINVTHLTIKEMEIRFTTDLGNIAEETRELAHTVDHNRPMPFNDDDPPPAEEEQGWSGVKRVKTIDVSTSADEKKGGSASVTLKVEAGEVPEGLARLLSRLNRLI